MSIYLAGNLITLNSLNEGHYSEQMTDWVNDKEVTKFLFRGLIPASLEGIKKEGQSYLISKSDVVMAIYDAKGKNYIGITGLHDINWITRNAEFRILIGNKDFWGKGFGAEATQLILAYGFEFLNLRKIWLGVNANNQRAFESYKKTGFTFEGTLRQEAYRGGVYDDIHRMSLLREEYNEVSKKWASLPTIKTQLRR
jgi:ribosomal-protein-alanine N-acetyltransferase